MTYSFKSTAIAFNLSTSKSSTTVFTLFKQLVTLTNLSKSGLSTSAFKEIKWILANKLDASTLVV